MRKRKNKLIKPLKFGILFFGISFFLWNCEKEYALQNDSLENASDSKINREKINLNKLTKVNNVLKTIKTKKTKEKTTNSDIIFFEDVIKLQDSLNTVNYTIKFKLNNTPKGVFYNLILGQDKDENFKTPYVIKYLCDQSNIELLYQNNFDWRYFKGKIEYHKYTDYFSLGYFSKTLSDCPQDVDSNGNPIPCDSQEVVGGNGGDVIDNDNIDNVENPDDNGAIEDAYTDSLDSNSQGAGGGGEFNTQCSFQLYVLGCGGSNSNTLHLHSECGHQGAATSQYYNILTCYSGFKKTATDCPDCELNPDGAIELSILDLCPTGKVLNKITGECVEKPCQGDPLQNPEIAPQTNSGIQGGLHDTCARRNDAYTCKGIRGRKWHNGVDIKNSYGTPIFAVYDGHATIHEQRDKITGKLKGAGFYVAIKSNVNGKTVRLVFFHLQEDNRIIGKIKAGDIIGYQGDSGNLKNGISQGYTESHVHIKAQENGLNVNPLNHFKTKIDHNTGQVTNNCQ
jgi:hypothetical protein